MSFNDTIAAIATPFGLGGIGIIKISGPMSFAIAARIFRGKNSQDSFRSHKLYYGEIVNPADGSVIDEALLTLMRKPKTYTGEDVAEINCHSGYIILQKILELVLKEGARSSDPGEFTKRAFLNGRIDLTQAEAVIDLIQSKTSLGLKYATQQLKGSLSKKISFLKDTLVSLVARVEAIIDFPEEDIEILPQQELSSHLDQIIAEIEELLASYEEGRIYREGLSVAIVGKPNVGKSSLLNALLGEKKAIVTAISGTTRDTIEEAINIKGIPLKIVDTAGMGKAANIIEEEGIKMAKEKMNSADLVILVLDAGSEFLPEDQNIVKELSGKIIVVLNKIDLPPKILLSNLPDGLRSYKAVSISALYHRGLEKLREAIFSSFIGDRANIPSSLIISRIRHKVALENALQSLFQVKKDIDKVISPEFIASDLKLSLTYLGEIAGETTSEEVLDQIFSQFCIGK